MYSKNIFSLLIVCLLLLVKINGEVVNNYTGECKDIYNYLEGQGKIGILYDCKVNNKGKVTVLYIYLHCLENEQLETILSYKTIDYLSLLKRIDYGITSEDIISKYGCSSTPTDYKILNTLTNLNVLYLQGEMDNNLFSNIPKSVELLQLSYLNLTQKMVDELSKLTNINKLRIGDVEFDKDLDFSKFKNLKNLDSIYLSGEESLYVGNLLKNCRYVKSLDAYLSTFNEEIFNDISYMTNLEEISLDLCTLEDDVSFSSLYKLKNLTTLSIIGSGYVLNNKVSPNFFKLTQLKSFTLLDSGLKFTISKDKSLSWANLKNLEYLQITDDDTYTMEGYKELFDLSYLGDLTNLKEVYIWNTGYSSLTENIGNLKNLEILRIERNKINSIPKSIGKLKNLKVLDIGDNNLTSLPNEIGNLENLEILAFSYNNIGSIPETIGNLANLKELSGGSNRISRIPSSIGNLTKLEQIFLYQNKIVEVPKSIGNLVNVTRFDIYSNNIKVLPDEIGNMVNLQDINFSYNSIEKLPDVFGNMKNLTMVDFSHNKIANIPSSLKNSDIKYLHLDNNNITDDVVPE